MARRPGPPRDIVSARSAIMGCDQPAEGSPAHVREHRSRIVRRVRSGARAHRSRHAVHERASRRPRLGELVRRRRQRSRGPRIARRALAQLAPAGRRIGTRAVAHGGRGLRALPHLVRGARHRAVGAPGGGPHGPRRRRPRDPRHAHRLGQVARGARHALLRHGAGATRLLHRAHQGAGLREVLRPGGGAGARQRRYDHGRHAHQHRGARHLLHGRDPRQPGAARGRRGGRGRGRHG